MLLLIAMSCTTNIVYRWIERRQTEKPSLSDKPRGGYINYLFKRISFDYLKESHK